MPLHRDIHWIGRQWAVTGHGVQLIDQKLQGFFDMEASKLWSDALIDSMYAKEWLNTADFEKALAVARAKYPQGAGVPLPPAPAPLPREIAAPLPVEPVAVPPAPSPPAPPPAPPVAKSQVVESPKPEPNASIEPPSVRAELQTSATMPSAASELPTPPPSLLEMQCAGHARFVRPWRVVARKI